MSNTNNIVMRSPKYRPSLSAQEIADCIYALETTLPTSEALSTLRIFQLKQSLGKVVPTNSISAHTANQVIKDNPTAEDFAALQAQILAEVSQPASQSDSQQSGNLEDIL